MSTADNKTYTINSPLENKNYNFEAIKNQIYDSLYSENHDFIQKIEQTSKTSIKNILIILNGDSGNVFHSLIISQHDYEYQLLIIFDKITKILNDKKILKVLLNSKDQYGNTPFYYFVYYDCDKIIEYFLNINEKIFDNCVSVLNENGKSPIDVYLDKDYDFLQKLKNNRENYIFNIESGFSNLDFKKLINKTFNTDEKILINLLYFYFLDLKEKNNDEVEKTLDYIKLIYKKEFDIEYNKIIKNEKYNNQRFKELEADLNNKIAYRYSDLINNYNEKLSEYKSENQYFICLNNNKGDIITKPNNKTFALFNRYYKFLSKSKKAENIELFNNAIIDDFKNTFNVINSTNEDVNSIFTKILKIPVDKNNNYVETKDIIKINVNKNIFNYNKILNNCDLVDIMFKFYSNIPVKFNTVLLDKKTIQINKMNSDFINIYTDKLKEKLIDVIKKSLYEKCNINLTNKNNDTIFDFNEIIKFNFLNTIARGIKKYYYQNLNETYNKYEDLTKIISNLIIKKIINSEKLLQDYKTEILLNSCINDDIEFLEDKNNFEIKKYYLAYYIYYYFYIQSHFYDYVLKKYERFYNTKQTLDKKPNEIIEIKLDGIKNIFPAIFYIYRTILKGSQLTIEEENKEKIYLSRGYMTKNNKKDVNVNNPIENESYKVEDYRKLLFNIFSFLFLSCDYFIFYNYGNSPFTYLGRPQTSFNNQTLFLYNLINLDPEYVQDFFMCQLVYLKLILISFKIQLINQRDYSNYIYNAGATKLNILNNAINQNEIFIYQRLKYIQQSFKTLDILINVNPDFQKKYDREIYDLLMDKLQELEDVKFDDLKIKYEIFVNQKKLMRFKGTETNKKEITKTLFNYIMSLESKVNELIKFKKIEKYNELSSLIFDDNDFDIENQKLFNMLDQGKREYEKYFDIKSQNYDYQMLTENLNCNISTPFYIRDYNSFLIVPPTYLNTYSFSTDEYMTLKYFKIYNSFNRITSFLYSYNSSIYNKGISSPYYYYFVKPAADYMFNMKLFSSSIILNKDKIKKINNIDSTDQNQKDKFDKTLKIITNYYNEDIFDFELTNLITEFKNQKNTFIFSILNDKQKQVGKFDKLWFQNPHGGKHIEDYLILKYDDFIDNFGDKNNKVIKKNIQEIKPVLNNFNYTARNFPCKKYNFISHINVFLNRYKIIIGTQHSTELKGYYILISKDKDDEKDYSNLIKGIIYSDDYFINNVEEPEIKNFDIKDYKSKIQKFYDFYNSDKDKRKFELLKINLNNLLDPEMFLNNIIDFNNLLLDFINKTKNLLILSIYKNITDDELKNRSVVLSITNVLNDNIYQQINKKLSGYKLVKKD